MDVDPYDSILQLAEGLDPAYPSRQHRLVREELLPRATVLGTESEVRRIGDRFIDETQQLILSREHHQRADLVRDYVGTLVRGLQGTVAKSMVILILLGPSLATAHFPVRNDVTEPHHGLQLCERCHAFPESFLLQRGYQCTW